MFCCLLFECTNFVHLVLAKINTRSGPLTPDVRKSSLPAMSALPFELLLALRYLRPKRTFVSIITIISVIGVALGVGVLVIVISVMSGFDQQMRNTLLGFNAHLSVTGVDGTLVRNYPAVIKSIAADSKVRGVAPIILGPVLLETGEINGQTRSWVPNVRGIDSKLEAKVSNLASNIIDGKFDVSRHGLLMGNLLAAKLGLRVGDRVNIYSPAELRKMKEARTKEEQQAILPDEYEVRGIFDVGWYEFNSSIVVVSLQNAQEMYELGNDVQGLIIMLDDPFQADAVKARLEKKLGPEFDVSTWLENSPLLGAVSVEKAMMYYILFFIVIVAAFGITCTTITFVVMKTREIGLLKAIGATRRQIMWVFMGQSLIVSLFGIAAGLGGGLLAVHYRNEFLEFMRQATGFELYPASIYGLNKLPAKIIPVDFAIICGGSLLICLAAAAFPARYASRLNPVEALRNE